MQSAHGSTVSTSAIHSRKGNARKRAETNDEVHCTMNVQPRILAIHVREPGPSGVGCRYSFQPEFAEGCLGLFAAAANPCGILPRVSVSSGC